MEEKKSMGGALVDVFDAALVLVKTEINTLVKKVSDIAKAKGIGALMLVAALGPLVLALMFLILAVFYGLMRLGLGAWAAALVIALVSLLVTGALVFLGLQKLGAEVDTDPPRRRVDMTEITGKSAQDEAQIEGAPAARAKTAVQAGGARPAPAQTVGAGTGAGSSQRVVMTAGGVGAASAGAGLSGQDSGYGGDKAHAPRSADGTDSYRQGEKVELNRDAGNHAAGENRVVGEGGGHATVRVEGGTTTVPVYEADADGQPQMYGSGLNEKLDAHGKGGHGHHDDHDDPNLQNPVVLEDAPGISVSTTPTYRQDMSEAERAEKRGER